MNKTKKIRGKTRRMYFWFPRCHKCGIKDTEPLLLLPPDVDFRDPRQVGVWEKGK